MDKYYLFEMRVEDGTWEFWLYKNNFIKKMWNSNEDDHDDSYDLALSYIERYGGNHYSYMFPVDFDYLTIIDEDMDIDIDYLQDMPLEDLNPEFKKYRVN